MGKPGRPWCRSGKASACPTGGSGAKAALESLLGTVQALAASHCSAISWALPGKPGWRAEAEPAGAESWRLSAHYTPAAAGHVPALRAAYLLSFHINQTALVPAGQWSCSGIGRLGSLGGCWKMKAKLLSQGPGAEIYHLSHVT